MLREARFLENLQAVVAAAVTSILRKQRPAGDAREAGGSDCQRRLADSVYALCCWRDRLARQQDESEWPDMPLARC